MIKKGIALLLTALLVLFAIVQWNDPDPWLWIGFYIFAAFLCISLSFFWRKWVIVLVCIYITTALLFAYFNWPEIWMGFEQTIPANINIEKARESCGLLVSVSFLALVFALNDAKKIR